MERQYQPGTAPTLIRTKAAARQRKTWLDVFNNLFYVVAVLALLVFAYYLFSFQHYLLLYLPIFLQATIITLVIALVSLFFAVIFGLIGAMGRLSHNRFFYAIATVYVEVVRGTPILVQLLLWYYGVGLLLGNLGFDPYKTAFDFMTVLQNNSLVPDAFDGYFYGIIGLSFNYGAYFTEVFRAGIEGVDKGQREAALSLGLDMTQIMRRIILPQAIRITIPPFTNYFITLIQDTALLSVLSVVELEHETFALALPVIDPNLKMFVFIFGGLFYFVLCYPLALLARRYEARLAVAY
jgi:His/Glu/Gln/Arg/opine family amino acid ABC transporter permease subunit